MLSFTLKLVSFKNSITHRLPTGCKETHGLIILYRWFEYFGLVKNLQLLNIDV